MLLREELSGVKVLPTTTSDDDSSSDNDSSYSPATGQKRRRYIYGEGDSTDENDSEHSYVGSDSPARVVPALDIPYFLHKSTQYGSFHGGHYKSTNYCTLHVKTTPPAS